MVDKYAFFDEYKKAEKTCNRLCGCDNGISWYIGQMEETQNIKTSPKPWKDTYYTLKHLRWLRNKIAHDDESCNVTEKDVKDIREFHDSLLLENDELSLFRSKSKKLNNARYYDEINPAAKQSTADYNDGGGRVSPIAFVIVVVAVILICYCVGRYLM